MVQIVFLRVTYSNACTFSRPIYGTAGAGHAKPHVLCSFNFSAASFNSFVHLAVSTNSLFLTPPIMRALFLLGLTIFVPIVLVLDSYLPKFYIFDPVKLQELSKASIAAGRGNATTIMHHLVESLQKEYGTKHINALETDKWFFKYVPSFSCPPILC
jgi:hypothetical protein